MTTNTRFDFPGFTLVKVADTSTHQVEIGTIVDGGNTFLVEMVRNNNFTFLPFMLASVRDNSGKVLWSYSDQNYTGVVSLAKTGGDVVLACREKGRDGRLEKIKLLSSLLNSKPIDLRTLFQLKQRTATAIGCDYTLTDIERKLESKGKIDPYAAERAAQKKATKLAAAIREQQEADRIARIEAKKARVATIMARPTVQCYTKADGVIRTGKPVMESEWPMLDKGTSCILVNSVNTDGSIIEPTQYFRVGKAQGKNPFKESAVDVTPTKKTMTLPETASPIGEAVVEAKNGGMFEVLLFESMDAIREAGKNGLNSGTLVAVNHPTRLSVFAMEHGKPRSVGDSDRIA